VVSFHGLFAPNGLSPQAIQANVLALHGYDDPMVTPMQVNTFAEEMTQAGADWQIHMYGHTKHAFTNPLANDPNFGTVYNVKAAQRSWLAMQNFFQEIFGC
jgi:dienelactone hydrolase